MTPHQPLLSLRGITKSFRHGDTTEEILHPIDLDLYPGELVAILGPSGSGKSTLLNILGLLSTPDTGTYTLAGQEIHKLSPSQLSATRLTHISFVFQAFHLIDHKNATANVELPLKYLGKPSKERRATAQKTLETLGLSHRAQAPVATLSGGEKQRVAIARALVTSPQLLLCDEPTGSLDSTRSQEVIKMLKAATTAERTTIIVTHDPSVAAHCDRTITITDGTVKAQPYSPPTPPNPTPTHNPHTPKTRWFTLGISEAWDATYHRIKRNLFTMLGVALGVASLVLTVGLVSTISGQISSAFNIYLAQHITVTQTNQALTAHQAKELWESPDFQRLSEINGVTSAALIRPLSNGLTTVSTAPENRRDYPGRQQVRILSASPNIFETQEQDIIAGRGLTSADLETGTRVAVASQSLINNLGITWQPGLTLYANNTPISIIGIASENTALSDYYGALYLPLGTDLPGAEADLTQASLATEPGAATQVASEAPYALSPHKPTNYTAAIPPTPERLKNAISQSQNTMFLLLSAVTLIIGAVGIMNTFLVAVIERRREIGLRLSLGLPPRGIITQFISESCITSAAGALIGILTAINALAIISIINRWTPIISPNTLGLGLAAGLGIGVLAGIYPAWKASKLDPVATLNQ